MTILLLTYNKKANTSRLKNRVEKKMALEGLITKYKYDLRVIEEAQKLPEDVRDDLIGMRVYGNSYIFIGFRPFDESQHWGSNDCEGLMKRAIVEPFNYVKDRAIDVGSVHPKDEQQKWHIMLLNAREEIEQLRKRYDAARLEIAENEKINPAECNYHNDTGKQFLKAQRKPDYFDLVREIIDKIELVDEKMDAYHE